MFGAISGWNATLHKRVGRLNSCKQHPARDGAKRALSLFSSFDNLDLDKMKLLWDDPFSSVDYTSMLGQLLSVCFT